MSLYNMLCGVNPASSLVLIFLNLTDQDFGRFRDTCISADGKTVTVFTRIGGGNREHYAKTWERLRQHPLYSRDYDCEGDTTFASVEFTIQEEKTALSLAMLTSMPEVGTKHPVEKFKEVLGLLRDHKPGTPPQTAKVTEVLKIGSAIVNMVSELGPGHRAEVSNEHGTVIICSNNDVQLSDEPKD